MPKIKKVAFFTNIISPYINDLFNNLSQFTDIDFEVIACSETEKDRKWKLDYLKTRNYKLTILKDAKLFEIKKQNRFFYLGGLSFIKRILKREFDTIIFKGGTRFIGPICAFLARIRGIKTVLWEQNSVDTTNTPLKKFVKKLYINDKLFTGFISYGNHVKDLILKLNPEADKKIFFALSPIDNQKYRNRYLKLKPKKNFIKKQLGINPEEKIILYTGRFVEEKNLFNLLEAVSNLKINSGIKFKCLLVGGGKLEKELEQEVINKGIQNTVYLVPFKEFSKLTMFYTIADVFVLPSIFEPWGLVVNEAMNFNLPAVVSNKVGCATNLIQQGGNGYVYDIEDNVQLFKYLLKAMNNSEEMGSKSSEFISNVNFEQVCRSINNCINNIKSDDTKVKSGFNVDFEKIIHNITSAIKTGIGAGKN